LVSITAVFRNRDVSVFRGIGAVLTGTVVDADASRAAVDVSRRVALFGAAPFNGSR
jgi:hypothetical protein